MYYFQSFGCIFKQNKLKAKHASQCCVDLTTVGLISFVLRITVINRKKKNIKPIYEAGKFIFSFFSFLFLVISFFILLNFIFFLSPYAFFSCFSHLLFFIPIFPLSFSQFNRVPVMWKTCRWPWLYRLVYDRSCNLTTGFLDAKKLSTDRRWNGVYAVACGMGGLKSSGRSKCDTRLRVDNAAQVVTVIRHHASQRNAATCLAPRYVNISGSGRISIRRRRKWTTYINRKLREWNIYANACLREWHLPKYALRED